MKMKSPIRLLLLLAIVGLSYFQPGPLQASFICVGDPPPCQCQCAKDWDKCAGDLPTEEAQEKCDPAYNTCYDKNCPPAL